MGKCLGGEFEAGATVTALERRVESDPFSNLLTTLLPLQSTHGKTTPVLIHRNSVPIERSNGRLMLRTESH